MGEGKIRPSAGKMAAVQLWEPPTTVTALRGFLGLCNYYSGYIKMYADLAAPLQEKLKLPREQTKAGSKTKVSWTPAELECFEKLKTALTKELELCHLDTSKPFLLRTDASDFAIGAALEQFTEISGQPTEKDLKNLKPGSTKPVAFMSRKLTPGQASKWDTRDKEAYAVVSALEKWASYIGYNPIIILTDHKALESWWKENIDLATGPAAPRRLRWHAKMNLFQLQVVYIPGAQNEIPDALSRWAYPASEAYKERSKHGTLEDASEMKKMIQAERDLERQCERSNSANEHFGIRFIQVRLMPSENATALIAGVTTRRGTKVEHHSSSISTPKPTPKPTSKPIPKPKPAPCTKPAITHHANAPLGISDRNFGDENSSSPSFLSPTSLDDRHAPVLPSKAQPLRIPSEIQVPVTNNAENVDPVSIWELVWANAYEKCQKWGDAWKKIKLAQNGNSAWPVGYQLSNGRLICDGKWCVPTELMGKIMRAHHGEVGHAVGEKLWKEICRHFIFSDEKQAHQLVLKIHRNCETCQACDPPRQPLQLKIEPTPIPSSIMSSVSIDLFRMPEILHDGVSYNAFACCVDRLSGWMVATPHHLRGLKASDVAKVMYNHWWSPHGIPSVICSDRGPHFAGSWWRAMCSHLGVRHGYAIAYHHASNGRAEVAGAQIQGKLRKLHSEGIPWIEGLQRAIRHIHDLPGEGGLSPYQILYGRDRPYAGVPFSPPTKLEDAQSFFARQAEIDEKLSKIMKDLHEKRAREVNVHRKELPVLVVGSKVWWLRPRGQTGDKLESYWVGPCKILERKSAHTYVIETREGHNVDAHRSQLKEHMEDIFHHKPLALFHYKQAISDVDAGFSEWEVERIVEHKVDPKDGDLRFLVKWENHPTMTWEPIGHFFHRYAHEFVRYCGDTKIKVDIVDYLQRNPISNDDEAAEINRVVSMYDAQISTNLDWEEPPMDYEVPDFDMDPMEISSKTQEIASDIEGVEGHGILAKMDDSAIVFDKKVDDQIPILPPLKYPDKMHDPISTCEPLHHQNQSSITPNPYKTHNLPTTIKPSLTQQAPSIQGALRSVMDKGARVFRPLGKYRSLEEGSI